jgi:hypothetical protein
MKSTPSARAELVAAQTASTITVDEILRFPPGVI